MKTRLHYYHFNIGDERQAKEYGTLCAILQEMGLQKFDSLSSGHYDWYKKTIRPLDNTEIDLETEHLFDNQWNTGPVATSEKGLRVFDWAEAIYPNRIVKEGQWLEQTEEMREIRRNTNGCGYCGHQEPAAKGYVFCPKCLGSRYLKEGDLHLLRMIPIYKGRVTRPELTDAERAHLLPLYKEAQGLAKGERLEQRKKDLKATLKKGLQDLQDEYKGLSWLLDHGIDTRNFIYYNYKGVFCYGWYKPVTEKQQQEMEKKLKGFPFPIEFEVEG